MSKLSHLFLKKIQSILRLDIVYLLVSLMLESILLPLPNRIIMCIIYLMTQSLKVVPSITVVDE